MITANLSGKKLIVGVLAAVPAILLLAALVFGWQKYREALVELENAGLARDLAVGELESKNLELETKIQEMERELYQAHQDNAELARMLGEEQNKNTLFAEQIGTIEQAVGQLVKLRGLDKELLQKYSKVYFLNENYAPKNLSKIDSQYAQNSKQDEYIHGSVLSFLYAMMNDAALDGINLKIISAFRSFAEQAQLKSGYKMTYGAGANKFSADQGYSEHQLGTTLDFTTKELGANYANIEKTDAYEWLTANAHKYGFILSYPKGNQYYIFEPWHWRFVGIRLAEELHGTGKYFYDLDQRKIDEYLISIFDW